MFKKEKGKERNESVLSGNQLFFWGDGRGQVLKGLSFQKKVTFFIFYFKIGRLL